MLNECCQDTEQQGHRHELQGSVKIGGTRCDQHNHRFATITGEAVRAGSNHFHEVRFMTDTYEGHEHEFCGKTSLAIPVGDRHVHFLKDCTETAECHQHEFRASTFLHDLIGD